MFFNQGQICSAPSRLIVEMSVKEEVLQCLLRLVPDYRPANPLDGATTSGAMVDHPHLDNVLRYLSVGKKEGANLLVGGERVEPVKGGAYMTPALFTEVKNDMRIAQEEIFGPVLSVISVKDEREAVETANASPFALAAAVWCDDIDRAHLVAGDLRAGTVHINCYGEDDITAPFGGFRQSGNGSKEKSLDAIDAYSEKKTTWLKLRK
jgi:gamma-glutamyl-gamma-aminobutyraldehyde dehydrogenase/4-guanidinobutyraldehyde dehydrogenase/NAD-dependent aldehyde dehydrogenase